MREILFRGKRTDNGEWVFGFYSALPDCVGIVHMIETPKANPDETNVTYFVDPSTVGQYTGLTDKNGKQIFEGDVVRTAFEDATGVIAFGDYAGPMNSDKYTHHIGFYPIWEGSFEKLLRKDLGFYSLAVKELEVIGNIHDNPELLEEVSDNG